MEDDDQDLPAPALGEAVRYGEIEPISGADMVAKGVAAGNIFRQDADAEVMALPEASSEQLRKQQELMHELEMRRKMKTAVVPTNDADVRRALRQLGEPITLFGEREMERRDRLRKLLAVMGEEELAALASAGDIEMAEAPPAPTELFYTEGQEGLRAARLEIARFSLQRAAVRLAQAKRAQQDGEEDASDLEQQTAKTLGTMVNQSSEVGDDRPIAACQFSPDGTRLATGAWSGTLKVWSMPNCTKQLTIKAHSERITGVAWSPEASTSGRGEDSLLLATGATDSAARLWSQSGKLLRSLEGHTDRLGRIAFHPMGRHLGTASFDMTWRLWDVETGSCLLEQEGHSRSVYTVAFQGDGALAASGGMDAIGRLWDVRTGRNVWLLEGHIKAILSLDFSPNGYHLATGSEDNTVRVYDLRKKGVLSILPGHTSLISQVRFEPVDGHYLLTSGYDNVSKLWCGKKLQLVKTLAGHEGKVMSSDICPDGSYLVVTTGYDRTIKSFAPDGLALTEE